MSDNVRTDTGPFAMVPEWLLYSAAVSGNAVKLFAILHRHEGKGGIHPGRKRLAALMGVSVPTVDRALKELEDTGAITREARTTADGDPDTNAYLLHFVRGSLKFVTTPPLTDDPRGVLAGDDQRKAQGNESPSNESGANAPAVVKATKARPLTQTDVEAFAIEYGASVVEEVVGYWKNHQGFQFARDKRAFIEGKIQQRRQGNGNNRAGNGGNQGRPGALERFREAGRVVS